MLKTTLALLLAAPQLAAQTTWHVDVDAQGPGDGTPESPYRSLQFAIEQETTVHGDTLLVHPGTYLENIDYGAKRLALLSVEGAGQTILQAVSPGPTVLVAGGQNTKTRLVGFTVRGGTGFDSGSQERFGGGIYVGSSNLRITSCVVTENLAHNGGGLYARDAVVIVKDTDFDNNSINAFGNVPGTGGAVFLQFQAVGHFEDCRFRGNWGEFSATISGGSGSFGTTLTRCEITNNTPDKPGWSGSGGVSLLEATLRECTIADNEAFGGHVTCGFNGTGLLEGCVIRGNGDSSRGGVGGIWGDPGALRLVECLIEDNKGWEDGGGATWATLERCTVRGNRGGRGGGIHESVATDCWIEGNLSSYAFGPWGGGAYGSELVRCVLVGNWSERGAGAFDCLLDRCTIVGNTASESGGGVDGNSLGSASAVNSIVRGNAPDQVGVSRVDWSIVEGGASGGTGNQDVDPRFVLPLTGGDFHLAPGSPAIDAGNPNWTPDPDGSPVDLGAFPFEGGYCPVASFCAPDADSTGCVAEMQVLGTPSIADSLADDLALRGTRLRNQTFGLLAWSDGADPGATGLCLSGSVVRGVPSPTGGSLHGADCSGELVQPFSQADMAAAGWMPGDTVYLQWWIRDPGAVQSFSDAVEVTLCN